MAGPYRLNADHLKSLCKIHNKASEITIGTIIINYLCVMKLPLICLIYSTAGNGLYILCTIDHDDIFLHGTKNIFYAKFTFYAREENESTCVVCKYLFMYKHN